MKKHFTADDIKEMKKDNKQEFAALPEDLQKYIGNYDKKWETGLSLYNFADDQKHNPITESDKKWIRESMVRVSELFLLDSILKFDDPSEADLFHYHWRFVYRIFTNNPITAKLGERCSVTVSLGRNEERGLESVERRPIKKMGTRIDALRIGKNELGSCEVEKNNVDPYLGGGLLKLPKMLRDILCMLATSNLNKVNNIASVGFLIMGQTREV